MPLISQIKYAVAGVLIMLAFAGGWVTNGWRTSSHAEKVVVQQVQHTAAVVTKQADITAAVGASAAAVSAQAEVIYRNINHDVIRYVQTPATPGDPDCTLDPQWVRLYNAAATASDPAPASGGNAAGAAPTGNTPDRSTGDGKGVITGDGGQLPNIQTGPGQA